MSNEVDQQKSCESQNVVSSKTILCVWDVIPMAVPTGARPHNNLDEFYPSEQLFKRMDLATLRKFTTMLHYTPPPSLSGDCQKIQMMATQTSWLCILVMFCHPKSRHGAKHRRTNVDILANAVLRLRWRYIDCTLQH